MFAKTVYESGWRTRWINNYIDAFVWGNYHSAAPGTDLPPYDTWPSLCGANLHQQIALGDHDPQDLMKRLYDGNPLSDAPILPEEFGTLWVSAFNDTYAPTVPIGGLAPEVFTDAYLMLWLVLWFQTASEDGIGCNTPPNMTPPDDDCGDQPPWVKPVVGDGSDGTPTVPVPPTPQIESDPDVAEIISGILLALLGVGLAATGNLTLGGAAIAGGIGLIIDGAEEINWGELRCYVHWYRLYLYHAFDALHEILSATAFRYPTGPDLANDQTMSQYFPGYLDPYDSGSRLTRSQRCDNRDCPHPSKPWTGGFDWMNPPTDFERQYTTAYHVAQFPWFFVDSPANPLLNGEVRIGGAWPVRTTPSAAGQPVAVGFGNAVDNAIDLFRHIDRDFPDWNLDADRGLAYHTWEFLNGLYTDPVGIQPEP